MRLLFLSPYVPSRIRVRPYYWIRTLAELGVDIHLVALTPPDDSTSCADGVRSYCSAVDLFPLSRARTLVNAVRALPSPRTPLQLAYSRCTDAERHVAALTARGIFDVVHIEQRAGRVIEFAARTASDAEILAVMSLEGVPRTDAADLPAERLPLPYSIPGLD